MIELLKPLTSGQPFGSGDEDESAGAGWSSLTSSADGSGGALMSFGSEALAKALSEKGGLGIARRVLDHFEAVQTATDKEEWNRGDLNRKISEHPLAANRGRVLRNHY